MQRLERLVPGRQRLDGEIRIAAERLEQVVEVVRDAPAS
jgi:hypothetical protein